MLAGGRASVQSVANKRERVGVSLRRGETDGEKERNFRVGHSD